MSALLLCLSVLITDGDTIRCNNERVRIWALDCPELHMKGGYEAKQALQNLLKGKVEIKRKDRDRYGRTVAIVFADGRDVARRMIASGTCKELCRYSGNKYATCER